MKYVIIALSLLFTASAAIAKPYGHYDLEKVIATSASSKGKRYSVDFTYLNRVVGDLALHARNYPAHFDSQKDRDRATRDVKALSRAFRILLQQPAKNTKAFRVELAYAAKINYLAFNLNVHGAGRKTDKLYKRLLALEPSNPWANYEYGVFLAGAGHPKQALPHLKAAVAGGITDANYPMGLAYLQLHETKEALKSLESYERSHPRDPNAPKIIDAIQSGNVRYKKGGD